ncbi:MAG: glutamate--tRNA ligase [Myxococcota bacterium]
MSAVRTRFAPSPTGSLHVGGARTALYSWLYARKHGGQFVLRIEDTDQARSSDEAAAGIVRDMRWLGLDWDEGPGIGGPHASYYQSERLDLYEHHVGELLDRDHAYRAWESREELDAMRKECEANKENFRFRRREPYTDDEIARFHAEKRIPVVRLKAPNHPVTVHDVVVGDMTQAPDELEDVVIRKGDGFPTYHFAVVVDDHDMRITHVLRGSEHLMNTSKHLGILEALGWESPVHGHLPIIFNMSGSKMSKRDKAKAAREAARTAAQERKAGKDDWAWLATAVGADVDSVLQFMKKKHDDVGLATDIAKHLGADLPMIEVMDFRRAGFLAEALLNYLALLGWSAGDDREYYTLPELAEAFTLERVNKQPAKFDPVKLEAMNSEYLRKIDDARYFEALAQFCEVADTPLARMSDDALAEVVRLFKSRARTFVDLEKQSRFMRAAPRDYDAKAVQKHVRKGGGLEHLRDVRTALSDVGRWEAGSIERAFHRLCESTGTDLGKYAQPVRIAISGTAVTPPLFDTLSALDREDVVARIDRAVDAWSAEP